MPCHLCAEKSENYPKPAIFKTPFMATAFPDFKPETDFLCPKCYAVYFRIIECKYGPRPRTPRAATSGAHGSSRTNTATATAGASTSARWRLDQPAAPTPPEDAEAEEMNASKRMRETQ